MHNKMQDNLKFWLQQCENDEKQVKRPKIISEEKMPSNFKLTTISSTGKIATCDKKLSNENVTTVNYSGINENSSSIANQVKEAIKIEFIGKDSGIKHDYKLNSQIKFEHFYEFLTSELRTSDLLHVIDTTVTPPEGLNEKIIEKHEFKVRDIVINREDKVYHSKILHIKDPVEIINKLREFK